METYTGICGSQRRWEFKESFPDQYEWQVQKKADESILRGTDLYVKKKLVESKVRLYS